MAKTLIIKGANFLVNKLDTVLFDTIPCTGISLDHLTLDVNYGLTGTIVATVTPADTTDEIIWGSSDASVATVADGVVTAIGLGTATITAACGSFSATCSVTVVAVMDGTNLPKAYIGGATTYSGGNGVGTVESNARGGTMTYSNGTLQVLNTFDENTYYPYPIPNGAKRIKITKTSAAFNVTLIQFYSLEERSTAYGYCAQYVDKITSPAFTDGVYVGEIPQRDGYPTIDGIMIGLYGASGAYQFSDSDFENITVEFLPEE